MALKTLSNDSNNLPNYIALSTDVVDNKIPGAAMIGKIVFISDTNEWKIITADRTLADYVFP